MTYRSKKMWLPAALLLTTVSTLLVKSLYWPTTAHQVLQEYSLSQTTNRVPQNCWNYSTKTH